MSYGEGAARFLTPASVIAALRMIRTEIKGSSGLVMSSAEPTAPINTNFPITNLLG